MVVETEEKTGFLKKVPPFDLLDEQELKRLSSLITVETYQRGTVILEQDGPPSDFLRIIKKGSVKVYVRSGKDEEILIDYRTEGDTFGFLSLVSADISRANVVAATMTTCYLIHKDAILTLLSTKPAFSEFFLKAYINKFIDKTYREMYNKSALYGGGDKILFTTTVGELSAKEVLSASRDISIREAAEMMSRLKISSLVLLDPDGIPSGIITDRDLRDKVVAKGRNVNDSISSIMSVSLVKVDTQEYCFEALLKMIKFNIHHLLVVENGKLKGILTNHDLMMLQGTSPISIVRDIESQETIEGLASTTKKMNKIVGLLLKEGAKAGNISRIITEINDRLVKKILIIAEQKFGASPLTYCWISMGSEGRKEQTFKTDQDNALIYEDPENTEEETAAQAYFSKFSAFVNDSLVACGFPVCPGNYMAKNPLWCQPLRVWKNYFSKWINTPNPESVLMSLIFFDFRPIHGNTGLADGLRAFLGRILKNENIFFAKMASVITQNRPPLGFFRSFIVEKTGEHKDELDLKLRGIGPMVDMMRLFSLENGVSETSTLGRLRALRDSHPIVMELGEELAHAFEFLSLLRIRHQYDLIEHGMTPDNFVNPARMSNLDKKTLKEVFQLILKVQDAIVEIYRPGMVNA